MNFLEVHPTTVYLKGITRSATFTIKNINDFLAASYSLTISDKNEKQLSVFPQKGILMHGQSQKIRIKYSSQDTDSSIREERSSLIVAYTFKTDYNKHYLSKNNLKSWDQLSSQIYKKEVEIFVSGERQLIQNCIKQEIVFTKTFGKDSFNISAIQQRQKSYVNDDSFYNLEINSKIQKNDKIDLNFSKSFQNQGKQNNILESKKNTLTQPSDNIFALQFGQSRVKSIKIQENESSPNKYKKQGKQIQSQLINQNLSKSFIVDMKTAQNFSFSNQISQLYKNSIQNQTNRSLQFIILAVIAAFFVALGNNIGRIIQ